MNVETQPMPQRNKVLALITLAIFVLGSIYLSKSISGTQALLYMTGGLLGLALYHAHYGFTSSFRHFITAGRGVGLRAQMFLFLLSNLLFLPFLLRAHVFGHSIAGYVSPVGLSMLFGAFLFGIGMQSGDGCASGTLYHIGGGDARGVVTLLGFVLGSVLGSYNYPWWNSLPHLKPISFIQTFGPIGGLALNALLMAIVYGITVLVERGRYGKTESIFGSAKLNAKTLIRGQWSWFTGSIVLAIGALFVLLLSGKPWGVTYAFALWGAKIANSIGFSVDAWGYWKTAANLQALHANVLSDVTTVLDIGVILGAFLAVTLSGKKISFTLKEYPSKMIAGLFIGGIMMGYGARLAFGCNIGAYYAGISSFSLHGWAWFIMAMLGSVIGIKFRHACGFSKTAAGSDSSYGAAAKA